MLQSLSGNNLPTSKGHRRQEGTGIAHTGYYRQARSCMCVHHHRGDIIGRDRDTGEHRQARSCMCVHHHRGRHHREDRNTGEYRQARSLAPVCFNLFRVMIPTPQRNTGGQATQGRPLTGGRPLAPSLLLPTSGRILTDHWRPLTGSLSRSCMLQSLSGNYLPTPKGHRRQEGQE